MPKAYKTILKGSLSHKIGGLIIWLRVSINVIARRIINKPLEPNWSILFEISTLFWRSQFNHAFSLSDIKKSRAYLNSCYSLLDPTLAVDIHSNDTPKGHWFIPHSLKNDVTMLYFHGGGYAFYLDATHYFIALLAQILGIKIFAPDYRLTPEHPHPAQIEDGFASYKYLLEQGYNPRKLIICGDSAGGHLVLMTLLKLREAGLNQPSLGIGLSPWTDIGLRGASQFGHDYYDLVQGYQTLQFASWLKGKTSFTDTELSPIYYDFQGIAPIYLQAGGKEILVDMIRDFAKILEKQDVKVRLDVWEHMTHEFHAYGNHLQESREAIDCIAAAIKWTLQSKEEKKFLTIKQTEVNTF